MAEDKKNKPKKSQKVPKQPKASKPSGELSDAELNEVAGGLPAVQPARESIRRDK